MPGSPGSWINDSTRATSLSHLGEHAVDVIVVGGGITGAGVALDAASRGLSVALLESHDLASGTSRFSSKLVHGGLRYLATGDVPLAWESAVERARLMTTIAPHLVKPIPFVIPDLRSGQHLEYLLSTIGTMLADGMRRATRLPGRILPRPRRVSSRMLHALVPAIPADTVRGGTLYWDGQLEDDARLVLGVARTAASLGAQVIRDFQVTAASATTVTGTDRRTRTELTLNAGVVINATGVWAADLEPALRISPSRGSHLIVRSQRLGNPTAAYTVPVPGRFGKFVFVLPQPDGLCYIGLTDVEDRDADGRAGVAPADDIRFLLNIVGTGMEQPLTLADVVGSYSGLRPLVSTHGTGADVSRRHLVLDKPGRPITIVGGKLTTYRRMAEDAVDAAVRRLPPAGRCMTRTLPLVGAGRSADAESARLVRRYGSEAAEVERLGREHPECAGPLVEGCTVTGEELLFGVLAEGAASVDDLLDRRTRLGLVPADAERARPAAERILAYALAL
ncbi:glycerol-3-phosphate dehydrogenase/oxidase [Homoserinimonas sp. A520]